MAETKAKPFKAVVSELTKYGFKIEGKPDFDLTFSKPEYRKEPFDEPDVGVEVEVLQWSKDKKDDHKIWVSSIKVTSYDDFPKDDTFGDEPELNNSRVKQVAPSAPQLPPVGRFATKEGHNRLDRKITLLSLHKALCPTLIQAGIDNPKDVWAVILQHEAMMNAALDNDVPA